MYILDAYYYFLNKDNKLMINSKMMIYCYPCLTEPWGKYGMVITDTQFVLKHDL